jgi:hypothetical protein
MERFRRVRPMRFVESVGDLMEGEPVQYMRRDTLWRDDYVEWINHAAGYVRLGGGEYKFPCELRLPYIQESP